MSIGAGEKHSTAIGNVPEPRNQSCRSVLLVVAIIGIATNFLLFVRSHQFSTPDSSSYLTPAGNLANLRGFTDSLGYPETTRTPGYPLLIVPFVRMNLDLKYLIILQHLVQILTALAAAVFAYQLTGSRRQGLIAGILLCLDLPSVEAANTLMSETFFTATLMIAVWLLWTAIKAAEFSPWHVLLSGLLAGATVLIRPITTYFFVPAVVFCLLIGKDFKWRVVLGFVLAFACLPLGWAIRNRVQTGYFVISSISGWDMLGYRAAGVLAIKDGGNFSANLDKRQAQLLREACESTMHADGAECLPLTIPQESIPRKAQAYMKVGTSIVFQHPVAYAKLAARGAAQMMLGGDANLITRITGLGPRAAKSLILIYSLPACFLAIVGLYNYWSRNKSFFWLAVLVVSYFVIISTGAEAYSRMRVPIMPIYAVLIAAGADSALRRLIPGKEKTTPRTLLVLG